MVGSRRRALTWDLSQFCAQYLVVAVDLLAAFVKAELASRNVDVVLEHGRGKFLEFRHNLYHDAAADVVQVLGPTPDAAFPGFSSLDESGPNPLLLGRGAFYVSAVKGHFEACSGAIEADPRFPPLVILATEANDVRDIEVAHSRHV